MKDRIYLPARRQWLLSGLLIFHIIVALLLIIDNKIDPYTPTAPQPQSAPTLSQPPQSDTDQTLSQPSQSDTDQA